MPKFRVTVHNRMTGVSFKTDVKSPDSENAGYDAMLKVETLLDWDIDHMIVTPSETVQVCNNVGMWWVIASHVLAGAIGLMLGISAAGLFK